MKIECEVVVETRREILPQSGRVATEVVRVTLEGNYDAISALLRDLSFPPDLLRRLKVR